MVVMGVPSNHSTNTQETPTTNVLSRYKWWILLAFVTTLVLLAAVVILAVVDVGGSGSGGGNSNYGISPLSPPTTENNPSSPPPALSLAASPFILRTMGASGVENTLGLRVTSSGTVDVVEQSSSALHTPIAYTSCGEDGVMLTVVGTSKVLSTTSCVGPTASSRILVPLLAVELASVLNPIQVCFKVKPCPWHRSTQPEAPEAITLESVYCQDE
eukprot:CAMPEP_0118924206 /NCGR_PEP_ID=MMETSP1169-20130426/2448_1 /TAXON_ID=36882 /ORGANISM="Pyramimonas obovata, Strain CCMP722" /LENGTH=214 /DNA_ID=CAMNT_0006865297 /DNA_START=616 /DNA_END=1257 /DNA_ORIENTATION=+